VSQIGNARRCAGSQMWLGILLCCVASSTRVSAASVPASLTVAAGGASNGATFTINPGLVITSLNPLPVMAGGPAGTLTASGSRSASGAAVAAPRARGLSFIGRPEEKML